MQIINRIHFDNEHLANKPYREALYIAQLQYCLDIEVSDQCFRFAVPDQWFYSDRVGFDRWHQLHEDATDAPTVIIKRLQHPTCSVMYQAALKVSRSPVLNFTEMSVGDNLNLAKRMSDPEGRAAFVQI